MTAEGEDGPTRAALGLVDSEARRLDDSPARSVAAKHMRPTARAGRRNVQSTNGTLFLEAVVGAPGGWQAK